MYYGEFENRECKITQSTGMATQMQFKTRFYFISKKITWPPGTFRKATKQSRVFFAVIFYALTWITEKLLKTKELETNTEIQSGGEKMRNTNGQ